MGAADLGVGKEDRGEMLDRTKLESPNDVRAWTLPHGFDVERLDAVLLSRSPFNGCAFNPASNRFYPN